MEKQNTGFTLLELVITIAIVALLATVAVPSYREMTLNNCLVTTANAMVTSLNQARSEAAARRVDVNVTAISANWTNGWTLWVDANNNGAFSDDEALRQVQRTTCAGTTIAEAANLTSLVYRPTGGVAQTATFSLCDSRVAETGRQVAISTTGRPAITNMTCD